jgi:hypothetical protein
MAVTNEEDEHKPLPTAAETAPPLPSTRCPPPPPVSKRANVYFDEELAVQHEEDGVQACEPRALPSSSAPGPDRSSGPTNQWRPGIKHLMYTSYVSHKGEIVPAWRIWWPDWEDKPWAELEDPQGSAALSSASRLVFGDPTGPWADVEMNPDETAPSCRLCSNQTYARSGMCMACELAPKYPGQDLDEAW